MAAQRRRPLPAAGGARIAVRRPGRLSGEARQAVTGARPCWQRGPGLAGGKDAVGLDDARAGGCHGHGGLGGVFGCAGGTTSNAIGPRPIVVTLTVWRAMVVNQSTRTTWPPTPASRPGISSQSSQWTDSRCTRTPGRASSVAMRPGNSVSAFRECGHQPPSTAPWWCSAGSKLTRGDGGPARTTEGALELWPGGMKAVRARPAVATAPPVAAWPSGAGGGRAEPLADGGGRVLTVPWPDAADSGMTFLLSCG